MPSELHEHLIDVLRFNTARFLEIEGFKAVIADAAIFNILHDFKHNGLIADCYFVLSEGVIVLEVGNMHDGKWRGFSDWGGNQIRVLRIGKDGSVGLLHPRHTEQERAFVSVVQSVLRESAEVSHA